MSKYEAEIEFPTTNEAGEDVIYTIGVTEYYCQQANPYADSDIDYYGYTDIEYDLIDEDGKVIPSDEYKDEIEELITEYFEEVARDEY
jgi:hypothetical protein